MTPEQVTDLARQLADGRPIDWSRFEPAATPQLARDARILERVMQFHAGLPPVSSFSSSLAKSLAHVSDEDLIPTEALATWGSLTILDRIGRGTFGEVYRAHDPRLNRTVALKLLRRRDRRESAVIEEGHLMARVRHPNVVTVHGAERIDGRVGLWMEYVDGPTLEEELKANGPLSTVALRAVGTDVCRAVAAVHRAGLLHRDVKAQNVMRGADGRVVLTDFGAGRELSWQGGGGAELAGTPLYLAPEVLAGQPATPQSDIYSLGVLLFHLATGSFPISAGTLDEVRRKHSEGVRTDIRSVRPDLPRALSSIIARATDPDPSRRYERAEDLDAALQQAVDQPRRRRRTALVVGTSIVVVLTATFALWTNAAQSPRRRLAFEPRDLVLITRFQNATGEQVFDGAIEYAFQRAFQESDVVGLVPIQRVHDTLQLMKRPLDTVVDVRVGREIAVRDGGIKAVLSGGVAKSGDQYILTAQLIGPSDGAVVATEIEQARGQSDVVAALSRLANRFRAALGERLPLLRGVSARPEPGTTRSLTAFQLYNRAYELGRDGQWNASLAVAGEVVKEDPQFSSGWIWLAWAHRFSRQPTPGRVPPEITHAVDRAQQLTEGAPQWEQLWIEGSAHFLNENYAAAVPPLTALLQLRPDHYFGASRLNESLLHLGRRGVSSRLFAQIADLRPMDPVDSSRAAASLLAATRDEAVARPYVERTRQIIQQAGGTLDHSRPALWIDLFEAFCDWRRRDALSASRRIDAIVERYVHGPIHEYAVFAAGHFYLGLGRLDRGEEILLMRQHPFFRELHTASIPAMRGDRQEFIARLRRLQRFPNYSPGLVEYIDAGLLSDARRVLAARPPTDLPGAFMTIARGRVARIDGHLEDAVDLLAEGLNMIPPANNFGEYHSACRHLAETLGLLGRHDEAIARLETCVAHEPFLQEVGSSFYPTRWLHNRLVLADEYRKRGRLPEAVAVEADTRLLLAAADGNHPLVQKLNAR